jgi:DNA repair exonuclease SbcCD ATPase subunit
MAVPPPVLDVECAMVMEMDEDASAQLEELRQAVAEIQVELDRERKKSTQLAFHLNTSIEKIEQLLTEAKRTDEDSEALAAARERLQRLEGELQRASGALQEGLAEKEKEIAVQYLKIESLSGEMAEVKSQALQQAERDLAERQDMTAKLEVAKHEAHRQAQASLADRQDLTSQLREAKRQAFESLKTIDEAQEIFGIELASLQCQLQTASTDLDIARGKLTALGEEMAASEENEKRQKAILGPLTRAKTTLEGKLEESYADLQAARIELSENEKTIKELSQARDQSVENEKTLRQSLASVEGEKAALEKSDTDLQAALALLIAKEYPFWVDEKKAHEKLATRCLQVISTDQHLRKDICNLQKPGTPRTNVDNRTIDRCLPFHVQYACMYWVHHLKESQGTIRDGDQAHRFLRHHLLHWLEVLSLIGRIAESIGIIDDLQTILDVRYLLVSPAKIY